MGLKGFKEVWNDSTNRRYFDGEANFNPVGFLTVKPIKSAEDKNIIKKLREINTVKASVYYKNTED